MLDYTPTFVRAAKRWTKKHPQAKEVLLEILRLLENDASDPRLKTHKLKGHWEGCWSCSGGYDLRIIFEFAQRGEAESIMLLLMGTHDAVY